MKLKVNEEMCIGCGACRAVCPEVFEVDGVAHTIVEEIPKDLEEEALDAKEGCPTSAIEEEKN